ncbi:ash family protein [Shigella sonnei]|nr:ash family protein [Shigella sonnei]EMD7269558.1 ash family protein [Escherichia coli]EFY6306208.1 ash family protein [Shigella sonnei]HAM4112427.1 ash family protein [Escherichia coli]HAX2029354.1 ash family protein [Escherichia coli]
MLYIILMVVQAGQPKGWPVSFGPVLRTLPGLPPQYRLSSNHLFKQTIKTPIPVTGHRVKCLCKLLTCASF